MAGNSIFHETSIGVEGIMESDIAPLIDKTMHDNPFIYIKSHPGRRGEGKPHLELHLSTTAQDSETARKRVTKALLQIAGLVEETKQGRVRIKKQL
jgi:molybdopterin-biosynthesis enzyme MoeA-like protein